MRLQWSFIAGIAAAILIALFAVMNMEKVRVNYLFGETEWPLIFIILGSALFGSIVTGLLGFRKISPERKKKTVRKERMRGTGKED